MLPQERGKDARWSAKAHAWVAPAAHEAGRMPYAALLVQGQQTGAEPFLVSLQELELRAGSEIVTNHE